MQSNSMRPRLSASFSCPDWHISPACHETSYIIILYIFQTRHLGAITDSSVFIVFITNLVSAFFMSIPSLCSILTLGRPLRIIRAAHMCTSLYCVQRPLSSYSFLLFKIELWWQAVMTKENSIISPGRQLQSLYYRPEVTVQIKISFFLMFLGWP